MGFCPVQVYSVANIWGFKSVTGEVTGEWNWKTLDKYGKNSTTRVIICGVRPPRFNNMVVAFAGLLGSGPSTLILVSIRSLSYPSRTVGVSRVPCSIPVSLHGVLLCGQTSNPTRSTCPVFDSLELSNGSPSAGETTGMSVRGQALYPMKASSTKDNREARQASHQGS